LTILFTVMRINPGTAQDIRNGMLIGAALLILLMPPASLVQGASSGAQSPSALAEPFAPAPTLEPDFGSIEPTPDARELVEWIAQTGDNAGMPFVLVDKQAAMLHVFNATASLQDSTPVLLGSAPGDDSVPGIGKRPVAEVRPEERTTPAGRFVGRFGHTLTGEDVVWVDYEAAVSMHRVRPRLQPKERRAERLASDTIEDNRISYGCINVPAAFYDAHIHPVFASMPALVYVLPEQKSLQQVFGLTNRPPGENSRVTRSAGRA
jgi:hypothetical protein